MASVGGVLGGATARLAVFGLDGASASGVDTFVGAGTERAMRSSNVTRGPFRRAGDNNAATRSSSDSIWSGDFFGDAGARTVIVGGDFIAD